MSSTITSTHPRLSTTLPTGKFSKMPAENCESTNCSAGVGRLMLPLIAAVNLVFNLRESSTYLWMVRVVRLTRSSLLYCLADTTTVAGRR